MNKNRAAFQARDAALYNKKTLTAVPCSRCLLFMCSQIIKYIQNHRPTHKKQDHNSNFNKKPDPETAISTLITLTFSVAEILNITAQYSDTEEKRNYSEIHTERIKIGVSVSFMEHSHNIQISKAEKPQCAEYAVKRSENCTYKPVSVYLFHFSHFLNFPCFKTGFTKPL